MSWLSDLWGDITGKNAVNKAADTQTALNAQNLAAQQQALAKQDEWTKMAMDLQKEMFGKSLAESQSNQADQMRLAGLSTAGNLLGQQMNLDQMIQLMQMQQAENRPTNMARQAAMQQALPALMALYGLQPVSVGSGYTEANPAAMSRNLLGELTGYNSGVQSLLSGTSGTTAAGAGTGSAVPASTTASTTTPYSNVNVDVNKLLNMNPTAQFQLKQAEDAVRRSLAARGGLNSSEFSSLMGTAGGNIAQSEVGRVTAGLNNLLNFGAGGQATSYGWQTPSVNLSNVGQDMSSVLNSAANNRSNLYSNYGSNMGNMMSNYGNNMGTNMSNMGQNAYSMGQNLAGINSQYQGGLLGGLTGVNNLMGGLTGLGNSYNQLSNMFGGSKTSSANTGTNTGRLSKV